MNQHEEMGPMTVSDALLVERWSAGDVQAFEQIFIEHYPDVVGLLWRLLGSNDQAEDVAQEVFLRLYRRPLPRGEEHNLRAWLYRVATHIGYNALRADSRRGRREETWYREEPREAVPGPERDALRAETRAEVRQVLAALPLKQAQILFLRHQGFSYAELAQIVGVRASSVGTLLARAERAFETEYRRRLPTEEREDHA